MTGKELLKKLQNMTPEELEAPVIMVTYFKSTGDVWADNKATTAWHNNESWIEEYGGPVIQMDCYR